MVNYYKTIEELPIYNFNKIIKEGNLSFLLKSGVITDEADFIWENIIDEFTKYVGFSKSYEDYMRFKKEEALLICQAYLEDKKYLLNFARVAAIQAEESLGKNEEDFEKSVALVSKYMGFRVNTKETTVKEFYSYVKIIEDGKEKN